MKKTVAAVLAAFILSFFGGCGLLGGILLKICGDSGTDTEKTSPLIKGERCHFVTADGYLNGIGLDVAFASLDNAYATAYKYYGSDDYEYFVFSQKGAREINITVIPCGKQGPEIQALAGAETCGSGGLTVSYVYDRRRHEDFYEFRCRAVVECMGDRAYVFYGYSSVSPRCEITELVTALFYAKG